MQKNLISAIAGWKSAALLALVAMVATVAFSGVLTSTNSADASAGDAKIDQGGTTDVTLTLNLSSAVNVAKTGNAANSAYTVTSVTSAVETVTVVDGDLDGDDADELPDTPGQWVVTDSATGTEVAVTLKVSVAASVVAGTELIVSAPGTDTAVAAGTAVQLEVVGVANPGNTVRVTLPAATADTYRVSTDSTATAGFKANPGRSFIVCDDDEAGSGDPTTCDLNVDSGTVDLEVAIAADSSKGVVYIVGDGQLAEEVTIKVNPAQVATGMKLSPPVLGISSSASGDGSTITITVTDNRGQAVVDQAVQLATTRGQFVECGTPAVTLPVCNVTTDSDGEAEVILRGDNRPGPATVTATAGTLTRTLAVTFFGTADSLTAAAAGGVATVDQGKSTFVFLTITDKDGNAVQGSTPGSSVTTEIENPTVVTLDGSVAYEGTASPADDVPACTAGTNVAGKCAVQISAGPTASRGIHTVAASMTVSTATGPKVLSDTIDIRVVGAPHSIETDAPDSVEPRTTVTINISVSDDNGDLVGGGTVKVLKLEGRGAVLGSDDDDNVALVGGKASFRYYATSTDTAAVFELTAGAGPAAVIEIIEIVVAAPVVEAEPEPEAPPATWNNDLVSGQNLVVWNGPDGADPSEGAADGVSAIWSYNTGSGSWDGYFPDAADVPGGNTLTSLSNGQAYVVIVD